MGKNILIGILATFLIIPFCLATTLLVLFLMVLPPTQADAEENLMQSDGAKESIILNHKNGIIESITLRYEWSD